MSTELERVDNGDARRSAEARRLIAPELRRPAVITIALALLVTAVLGVRYADRASPGQFDRTLDDLLALTLRNEFFNSIDVYFHQLGDPIQLTALVSVVALAAALLNRRAGALLVVIGTVAAVISSKLVLKPIVGRHHGDVLSYPSTHVSSTAAVAIASVIMVLSAQRPRSFIFRLVMCLIPLAIAIISSVAIVAERTHYTTDAIGGWCLALAIVLVTALLIDAEIAAPRSRPCQRVSGSA